MSSDGSITHWIREIQDGNQEVAQELWERYFAKLVQLAHMELRGAKRQMADEEDVAISVFDSFCRAAENGRFPDLADRDSLWRLLVRMTARKSIDLRRRETRLRRGGPARAELFGQPTGEEALAVAIGDTPSPEFAAMMAEELRELLEFLDDGEFRAIALGKMEGYSNEELAERLDCSVRTIERRLSLIREKLKRNSSMMNRSDQLSIEDLERIDHKCCQFEKELKQGNGSDLGEHLAGTTGRERATLLLELLALDIDYRQRRGQRLPLEDYAAKFPDDREVIEKAFARSEPPPPSDTARSGNGATRTAAGRHEESQKTPATIGRYRVLNKIASGGFAVVYRGFDEELARDVAIKVPHRSVISDGRHAERFMAEARLTAGLNHPGIVPVYDVGRTDNGEFYVVAKFMEGGDLSTKIRRSRPLPEEAAAIVAQIAEALHCAHEQRLVHRDIKPSNILLDAHGGVYLADFGAAVQESASNVIGFVGTPAYMSPEQARGEGHRVDVRTDVFALGVVLYELLTGLRPFQNHSVTQLLADIIATDPVPPGQINTAIPAELERICLKAMSKRAADRYTTARELCWDLRQWSTDQQQHAETLEAGRQLPVIPKGLRSFDGADAEFFLQLLPGPRDRHGMPESIRFWKSRIEEKLPEQAVRVGVIFGPSGSGKSSLIKAGCLPRLPRRVLPIYIEANATETERNLENALHKACGSQGKLPEMLRKVRKGRSAGAPKILIVVDQFEQWLHAHDDSAGASLTAALRQCDGVNVQCLLLVRDDFWMPLVRFMAELEVPLVDGENMMAVDLFDLAHAKKVLRLFGQAYEKLPSGVADTTREQKQFVDDAIDAIGHEGCVSPVRLSLFAEMMKHDSWEPATLRRLGGAEGLGVDFLERSFDKADSPPHSRAHAAAARDVLKALLPEPGVHIRGHFRPAGELLVASGYFDRPERFEDLLQLLDHKLRLVTPTNPESQAMAFESGDAVMPPPGQRLYQLTHDFMVEPIREWVTQGQRQTRRGRAELCLAERVSLWKTKPESRQLPGFLEWARIRLFTDPKSWTPAQRKMLRHAARRSLVNAFLVAASITLLAFVGWEAAGRMRAKSALATIRSAGIGDLLKVIADSDPVRPWLTPLLNNELAASGLDPQDARHMRLMLLRDDQQQAKRLCHEALSANPSELRVIREGLVAYSDPSTIDAVKGSLWTTLQNPDAEVDERFRAACLLAGLEPASSQWNQFSEDIAVWLVTRPVDEVADWSEALRPVNAHLIGPLERAFLEMESEGHHDIAAFALSNFLEDADHLERVVDLIKRSRPSQLPALVSALQKHGDEGVVLLQRASQLKFSPRAEPAVAIQTTPADSIVEAIQDAQGVVTPQFAICQMLPLGNAPGLVESLREIGYRPIRLRPFQHGGRLFVAGIWSRDGYDSKAEFGIPANDVLPRNEEAQRDGLGLDDLAAYVEDGQWRFVAVWSGHPDARRESKVALIESQTDWQTEFDKNVAAGFKPHTYQLAIGPDDDLRRTQVWRRNSPFEQFIQRTNISADRLSAAGRGNIPADASIYLGWRDKPFGGVWVDYPYADSKSLVLESPDELPAHLDTPDFHEYRPIAISLASDELRDAPASLTVWQRQMSTEEAKQRFADIQSNLLAALMALGETESTLPYLRHSADPTLRSYIIRKLAASRASVKVIEPCLHDASLDADVRQALILALGNYARSVVNVAERTRIGQYLQEIYTDDNDIGVRSAAEWVLRHWDLAVPNSDATADGEPEQRNWLVTPSGQTMAVLDFPHNYQPRSAVKPPTKHRFAIATKEVTVKEFARFRPNHPVDYRTEGNDTCPAHMMDWYTAAAYCNWLNEEEGIGRKQWCYLPNDEGEYADGMTIAPDFLERQGYRLPLAGEWLFAASAATRTTYFFGSDAELMPDYAWMARNSQGVHHPVGMLQPNRFGLFDVYGSVKEWAHSLEEDTPTDQRVVDGHARSVMGGCYVHFQLQFKANYAKHGNPPQLREQLNGFRIARTVRPSPAD